MKAKPLTAELKAAALELAGRLGRPPGIIVLARELGISNRQARKLAAWYRSRHEEAELEAGSDELKITRTDDAIVIVKTSTTKDPEAIMAEAGIDRTVWRPDKVEVSKHDQGTKLRRGKEDKLHITELWRVFVRLVRKVPVNVELATRDYVKRIGDVAPTFPTLPRRRLDNPHLLVISLVDHHFGKLAWHGETGSDYDLRIAERLYLEAVEDILAKVRGYPVERILFPVGHDLFNYDTARGETANLTPQDNDSRPAKVYATALAAVCNAVAMAARLAPVEVRWIRGNHDPTISYWLALAVAEHFRHTNRVEVVTDPKARQYVRFGNVLLGLTHGDMTQAGLVQLPLVMAVEADKLGLWSGATCRELLLGHWHKRKELRFVPLDTYNGVVMRVLPSLCGTDAWHYLQGFVGNDRVTDALLYSRDRFAGAFPSYAAI